MDFSKILKQERKKQNLTQYELAELLNVSDKTISSWENGRSYPDVIMLKSIAKVLKIDVKILLDAEDFSNDVNEISKEQLNENHLKEINYIKNVIISIFLNITMLLIPIAHYILSKIYRLKTNSSITHIPNYSEYEKISNIVIPIIITCSIITSLFSLASFIISTIKFKKCLVDTNYNVRYKLIMSKCINIYSGIFILILFLTISISYVKLNMILVLAIILLIVYILFNIIINAFLNIVQIYNSITIFLLSLTFILFISLVLVIFYNISIIIITLIITCIFISFIILSNFKEVK